MSAVTAIREAAKPPTIRFRAPAHGDCDSTAHLAVLLTRLMTTPEAARVVRTLRLARVARSKARRGGRPEIAAEAVRHADLAAFALTDGAARVVAEDGEVWIVLPEETLA